jgi:hypothetical protein
MTVLSFHRPDPAAQLLVMRAGVVMIGDVGVHEEAPEHGEGAVAISLSRETAPPCPLQGSRGQRVLCDRRRDAAGVCGAGISGAGVPGVGFCGAGVSGAGVSGAGVPGAGISGAGVCPRASFAPRCNPWKLGSFARQAARV